MRYGLIFLCCALLAACADEDTQLPPQYWQGIEIAVETRPNPPQLGVTEVLVSATRPGRVAEHSLLISLRMRDGDEWVQAIQDGRTGIYRRGVEMTEAGAQTLFVQLQRLPDKKEQIVLRFPLTIPANR